MVDYFDVDPDLASSPEKRMDEFKALVKRCLLYTSPTHCQRGRTRDCGGAGPQPEAVAGNGISGKFWAERIRANEKGPGGALSPAPLARPRGTGFPSPFPVIRRDVYKRQVHEQVGTAGPGNLAHAFKVDCA